MNSSNRMVGDGIGTERALQMVGNWLVQRWTLGCYHSNAHLPSGIGTKPGRGLCLASAQNASTGILGEDACFALLALTEDSAISLASGVSPLSALFQPSSAEGSRVSGGGLAETWKLI